MSREAIAAALARDGLSVGERLVAFSLASFADRENRTRPGTPAAAGRAGLERSTYLEARDRLVQRGLVVVEVPASGRGRASTLGLPFAFEGPWWEGEINAELFEAVLGYSRAEGCARLLLAAMAALADEQRVVAGLTTAELCIAAGITDRTYRRVWGLFVASGELMLRCATRGRGNTNSWEIPDPRKRAGAAEPRGRRRLAPPRGARPLVATVPAPADMDGSIPVPEPVDVEAADRKVSREKGCQDRTVSAENRPAVSGVSAGKGCQDRTVSAQNRPAVSGISAGKHCQDRTLWRENPAETPAENPAENPAPYARAGSEPQNPRTPENPPNPPKGGPRADQVVVEETYITERGRRRRRLVTVDLAVVRARLAAASASDRAAWEQVRELLRGTVGDSTFEIWLAQLEPAGVDRNGRLVISVPVESTRAWVHDRFGRLLERCAAQAGRGVRFADEREQAAVQPRASDAALVTPTRSDGDDAPRAVAVGSACASSYTPVHKQQKEVSG